MALVPGVTRAYYLIEFIYLREDWQIFTSLEKFMILG